MSAKDVISVGVLTPHTTPGPEVELPAMAPTDVRVALARVDPRGGSDRAAPARRALVEAASALPPSVETVALASTGSGYAWGYDGETALVEALRSETALPVHTPTRAAVSALRSHHVERLSIVHPPWFGQRLHELGVEYFDSQGFDVVDARLAEVPDDPDRVPPSAVTEWVDQHLSDDAEAVFIGGNGFRAARAVRDLESRTGRLVLEANQVLLWSILRDAGATVRVRGFGALLDGLAHTDNSNEE